VLRRILELKREEVAGGWRGLHNEELHNLYTSSYIIRVMKSMGMRWEGHGSRVVEMRNAYKIWRRRRWEYNVRMSCSEIGWEVCDLDSSGSG
jgi:hypothetical protein